MRAGAAIVRRTAALVNATTTTTDVVQKRLRFAVLPVSGKPSNTADPNIPSWTFYTSDIFPWLPLLKCQKPGNNINSRLGLGSDLESGVRFYRNGVSNFFSERELLFMFAICRRPSVCLSVVCRLSVTFVHPTQPIEIFGNVSAPCNTLVT